MPPRDICKCWRILCVLVCVYVCVCACACVRVCEDIARHKLSVTVLDLGLAASRLLNCVDKQPAFGR